MRLEKPSKDAEMNSLAEMGQMVRVAAEPRQANDNEKSRCARAAQVLRLPFRRAKAFWYGEARKMDADEWRQARARAEPIIARLKQPIEWMERTDPDFYRPEIDRLRRLIDPLG